MRTLIELLILAVVAAILFVLHVPTWATILVVGVSAAILVTRVE